MNGETNLWIRRAWNCQLEGTGMNTEDLVTPKFKCLYGVRERGYNTADLWVPSIGRYRYLHIG
jgi:hypothetical protein